MRLSTSYRATKTARPVHREIAESPGLRSYLTGLPLADVLDDAAMDIASAINLNARSVDAGSLSQMAWEERQKGLWATARRLGCEDRVARLLSPGECHQPA